VGSNLPPSSRSLPEQYERLSLGIAAVGYPSREVFRPGSLGKPFVAPNEGRTVSLMDKASGRIKKAVGDLTGDPSTRREGQKEERKGEAKEDLARTEEKADRKADEVRNLERET
jgi:uncharacterized protein YjbJ (UPF0337 family)